MVTKMEAFDSVALKDGMKTVEECMSVLKEEITNARTIFSEMDEGPTKVHYQVGYSYRISRHTENLLDALRAVQELSLREHNREEVH